MGKRLRDRQRISETLINEWVSLHTNWKIWHVTEELGYYGKALETNDNNI